ncbi:hypothetical protein NDU88_011779 [Pleurodeles waltl]|uniref:Uncharacterized protein n=1 Tax=Pleurodeles waltl TaxID=8319 RepID=A0AAV7QZK4_PLEWA|nr:hypothetical protein NDU88_011779 [Pleurodeles waltl]
MHTIWIRTNPVQVTRETGTCRGCKDPTACDTLAVLDSCTFRGCKDPASCDTLEVLDSGTCRGCKDPASFDTLAVLAFTTEGQTSGLDYPVTVLNFLVLACHTPFTKTKEWL